MEQLEYLFTRVPKKESRKDFEKHSLEHVLSFQRRVLHTKRVFMHRGQRTPLGVVEDYWDRTEADRDMHSYFLCTRAFAHRLLCGFHVQIYDKLHHSVLFDLCNWVQRSVCIYHAMRVFWQRVHLINVG